MLTYELYPVAATMATVAESPRRTHALATGPDDPITPRTVPILTPTIQMSAPSPGEPMEITTPTSSTAPAVGSGSIGGSGGGGGATSGSKSPPESGGSGADDDRRPDPGNSSPPSDGPTPTNSSSMPAPSMAAAAVHQPKIVQTAFIHKLYK